MLLLLALACQGPGSSITVHVTPGAEPAISEFASFIPHEIVVSASADPAGALAGRGLQVALVDDLECVECWRIDETRRGYVVHGGDLLGLQYGLGDLLEQVGFRFFHPYRTHVPDRLAAPTSLGVLHEPEMARRGLHLHTLHPTEGLYDFWLPGPGSEERARRVIDWVVKNRGDYLQWVALDDIVQSESKRAAWQAHTGAIVSAAHARGVEVGVGVQLFGSGNLQRAFDLLDDPGTEEQQRAAIRERMEVLVGDIPFDVINLSFGEFFGEAPEQFIASVDLAYATMLEVRPELEVSTVIHVGDDLWVEYQGEQLIYYFLVKYADPAIVPWVHSVMYYNLFEDAGGAYHHDEFTPHREFLLERIEQGSPVAYFPESAYWIAFDDSIPTYLPLYMRSRHTDLAEIRANATGGRLDQHVLFSSGWEWGYWQTDAATLRMNYELPADWREPLRFFFEVLGEPGRELAEVAGDLADAQHGFLIERRLAAYLASKDSIMEFGYTRDIVSQPRPVSFAEVAAMSPAARAAFADDVVSGLGEMAASFGALRARADAVETADPWLVEVVEGVRVDAIRAEFAYTLYGAIVRHADGADAADGLHAAEQLLAQARTVVQGRHQALHDPDPERLLTKNTNPTIYQYGYLRFADELCFWERELIQARNVVHDTSEAAPGCAL